MYPKSKKSAIQYAASLTERHGEKWIPFATKPGSEAFKMGVKFGACKESERAEYEGGVEFIPEAVPQKYGISHLGYNTDGGSSMKTYDFELLFNPAHYSLVALTENAKNYLDGDPFLLGKTSRQGNTLLIEPEYQYEIVSAILERNLTVNRL